MRSNTITPLLQLAEWFGIDPWKFNGINRDANPKGDERCRCLFQYPWIKSGQWARDELISMLEYAEQVFVWETQTYPGEKQILEEHLEYYGQGYKFSYINSQGRFKSVEPNHTFQLREFGTYHLELINTVMLTRLDGGGQLMDDFTLSVTVPAGTNADNVRVFFTQADANYLGDPDFQDFVYEVRPIRNKGVSGTTFSAIIPSYLLRKPSLDNHEQCLLHEEDTYVEEVVVYLNVKDVCQDGFYVSENSFASNCIGLDCDETVNPFCVSKRLVGGQIWAVPKPFRCIEINEEIVLQRYCIDVVAESVKLNYITGFQKLGSGDLQFKINEIIMKLAVGLADCVKQWCPCDGCSENKLNYYRKVLKEKIEDSDPTIRGLGNRFQLLLTPQTMQLLSGYPLYLGLTMAYKEMLYLRGTTVEGAYVG